jgi:hypothetical protein
MFHLTGVARALLLKLDVGTPFIGAAGRADVVADLGLAALAAEIQLRQLEAQVLPAVALAST